LNPLALFAWGLICGLIPPLLWAWLGGDERFELEHPCLRSLLHAVHHWQFGIIILAIATALSMFTPNNWWDFLLGFGASLAADDLAFHSWENYFVRREEVIE